MEADQKNEHHPHAPGYSRTPAGGNGAPDQQSQGSHANKQAHQAPGGQGARSTSNYDPYAQDANRAPNELNKEWPESLQSKETRRLARTEKLWELMGEYIGHDKTSIQKQIVSHIEYTLAKSRFDFNIQHCCQAVKSSLFDRLIECGNDTNSHFSVSP